MKLPPHWTVLPISGPGAISLTGDYATRSSLPYVRGTSVSIDKSHATTRGRYTARGPCSACGKYQIRHARLKLCSACKGERV